MHRFLTFLPLFVCLGLGSLQAKDEPKPVKIPSHIDHSAYDRLLKKYVDAQGLVAYAKWKADQADMAALDNYLGQYAKAGEEAKNDEKGAALINAYNAFTLQWILKNYPTESIWSLDDSFSARRHKMGGQEVSLNDIEKGSVIPQLGWKGHGVLVCAARSCPPLRAQAYQATSLDDQIASSYRRWLARPDLNEYLPEKNKVEISSIFKWFKDDFAKVGGPQSVLAKYGPSEFEKFLASKKYEVGFKSYNWGLNDQGEHGRHYSKANLFFDNLF